VIDAEDAAARLAAVADTQWRERAADRIAGLPRRLRPLAEPLVLLPDPFDLKAGRAHRERLSAAAEGLDEIDGHERERVMTALHPTLGRTFARWWVDQQAVPYQRGWTRKAFRAPHMPEASRAGRLRYLEVMLTYLGPHPDADPVWVAGWAGHLASGLGMAALSQRAVGTLLAVAIDEGGPIGDAVVDALVQVGNGEHPIGIMGDHVIAGLLGSSRPDAWDYVRRLLLAAQRQEGLRQSVLEAADEGHPSAFDLMLSTVLDEDLLRFAAAVRAAGVWLGFDADVSGATKVADRVRRLLEMRADADARAVALASGDPWETYVALCAAAMRDVAVALTGAAALLDHSSPDIRATALRFGATTGLLPGQRLLLAALDDPDLNVAALAAELLSSGHVQAGAFDALTRLVPRLPEKVRSVEGLGVEVLPVTVSRQRTAAKLVTAVGDRPLTVLVPWLAAMDAGGRHGVAHRMAQLDPVPGELREPLLGLMADRSSAVRKQALTALRKSPLAPEEAPAVEALLTRSATDVRRAALTLLASLPSVPALASADRLSASSNRGQRDAAVELRRTVDAGQATDASGDGPTEAASEQRDAIVAAVGVDAGPGPTEDLRATLVDETRRTPPRPPRQVRGPGAFGDDRARRVVEAVDDIAEANKNTRVVVSSWQGSREVLFGDLHHFPSPFAQRAAAGDEEDDGNRLVLSDVFRPWWADRPDELRNDEATDALRAYVVAQAHFWALPRHHPRGMDWSSLNTTSLVGEAPLNIRNYYAVVHVLDWLMLADAGTATVDECLDAFESLLAMVPPGVVAELPRLPRGVVYGDPYAVLLGDWRLRVTNNTWTGRLRGLLSTREDLFTAEQLGRWFGLMRWLERPQPEARTMPVEHRLLTAAYAAGTATDDDVAAAFLHPRNQLFRDLTRHWRSQLEARQPALVAIADRVRDAVVRVEMQRGDLPTPTSAVALNVGSVPGVPATVALLRQLGRTPFIRGWNRGSDSKDAVLSHLLRVSFPGPDDTAATLAAAVHHERVPNARLVDLAMYAPQWAALVEEGLGWTGLASGVLWLHAHTKDRQWTVDPELRQSWAAMVAERTPLTADDLVAGAVDVAWFTEAHEALDEQRWKVLHKAAKNASGGNGHRRAQVFAEAMLGQLSEETVVERITAKRNQDAVRALGLLPLPPGEDERAAAVQRRYGVLREFERGSRQFGNQRQTSERTAVRIGVDNLSRTAGYADPARFIWAVEAAEAGDLSDGPVHVTHGEVTLTLAVTDEGVPELTVRKGEKVLASVPAAVRKQADVVELRARKTALTRQASRVRASLEAAMVGQDSFTDRDFASLATHPVVAPMLDQLVWVDGRGRTGRRVDGRLVGTDGKSFAASGAVRIAHPVDLLAGDWIAWQREVFGGGRRQPFKQVFRELYVVTDQERVDGPASHRYDGHQLQPRQALALFTRRGWLTSRESGDASRVFHAHGIAARVEFVDGFLTPLEADLPTIGGVYFTRRGEHVAQPIADVPPVVFSETMRDLDLVVSVAHAGGVDPEATASTTEMRATLVRETARLMRLDNLSYVGSHVLIEGALGEYSVHLGSGTVHRRPGGAVCIVPVGSQHRGRLFLPFADDDPKTAEVVAKVLLLARDREIKDPTILAQLRS
jgi:hypothetical protein